MSALDAAQELPFLMPVRKRAFLCFFPSFHAHQGCGPARKLTKSRNLCVR